MLGARLQGLGARYGFYFGVADEVTDYAAASRRDIDLEVKFKAGCFRRGVYLDANWHGGFSAAHTAAEIDRVLEVFADVMQEMDGEAS